MMRFAEVFPNREIVSALLRQLSWTPFLAIIYLKDSWQRDFYAELCRIERWMHSAIPLRMSSFWLTLQGTMWAASTTVCPSAVTMRVPQKAHRWS